MKTVTDSGHTVELQKGERAINAASILGVVSLGVNHGDEVTLRVQGDDDEAVLDQLATFLEKDHDA